MPASLGVGHVAVKHGDVAEAGPKTLLSLWREADLGDQHNRLAPVRDYFLNRANVNFGLAAAGDAVQHDGLLVARLERSEDRRLSARC